VRRGAAWLVTLPIALVGIEAAHALANAVFGSPEEAGELFASGSSSAGLVPLLAALALGLLLVGLGGRVAGWWLPCRARLVALPFALLPPVAFVVLELVEGVLHRGAVPWDAALEPTLVFGLLLQFPFALSGYLVARGLLRLSDAVRRLIVGARRARPLAPPPSRSLGGSERTRAARRHSAHCGRGPPVGLLTSS